MENVGPRKRWQRQSAATETSKPMSAAMASACVNRIGRAASVRPPRARASAPATTRFPASARALRCFVCSNSRRISVGERRERSALAGTPPVALASHETS